MNKLNNILDNLDTLIEDGENTKKEKNVKIIKQDRGLIEHTKSSKVVLTEDNKQVLMD